jgi:hypothetical protein
MSISCQVTQLACNLYDHLPSFLNTAVLKKVEVIIKVSPASQATSEWHPVTSLVAQTFLEGLNCLGSALA